MTIQTDFDNLVNYLTEGRLDHVHPVAAENFSEPPEPEGKKYDQGKLRFDLVPSHLLKAFLSADYEIRTDAPRHGPLELDCALEVLESMNRYRQNPSCEDKLPELTDLELAVWYTVQMACPRQSRVQQAFYLMREVAKVLTYGANKYEANSWQKVPNGHSRYFAALLRHLDTFVTAFCDGEWEPLDSESGLRETSHILCNLGFLLSFSQGFDELL
jgi:hypothetical protein